MLKAKGGPLVDEDGHLTNRQIDKAKTLNAFLRESSTPPVFNISDGL